MKYAQDPKHKTPTMTELTSDLALRYIETAKEEQPEPVSQVMSHIYLMALARILFDITGQSEWSTKSNEHRLEANRIKVLLVKRDIGIKSPAISVAV